MFEIHQRCLLFRKNSKLRKLWKIKLVLFSAPEIGPGLRVSLNPATEGKCDSLHSQTRLPEYFNVYSTVQEHISEAMTFTARSTQLNVTGSGTRSGTFYLKAINVHFFYKLHVHRSFTYI